MCGLPIALAALAVRASADPGEGLPALVTALTRRQNRLNTLSGRHDPTASVRAAFDLSYNALTPQSALLYRRLSWHPGPHITPLVARPLTGNPHAPTELVGLSTANLLTVVGPDTYVYHSLLGLHAEEKAAACEPAPNRNHALNRLLMAYSSLATSADRVLRPYARNHSTGTDRFSNRRQALDWIEHEHANLAALVAYAVSNGAASAAMAIMEGLWPLFLNRGYAHTWLRAAAAAHQAALDAGDEVYRGRLLNKTALVLGHLRRAEEARGALGTAEDIWVRRNDSVRLAQTHQRRGLLGLETGSAEDAIGAFSAAIRLSEDANQPHDMALALMGLGQAFSRVGLSFPRSVLT